MVGLLGMCCGGFLECYIGEEFVRDVGFRMLCIYNGYCCYFMGG